MGEAKHTEMIWTCDENECDFTKRVYENTIERRGVRGRPPVKYTGLAHCASSQCANRTLHEARFYVHKFALRERVSHYANQRFRVGQNHSFHFVRPPSTVRALHSVQ